MKGIPQRLSLVAQTVTILREEIQSGSWSRALPGEHQLCTQLQVSRVTLRAALAQLEREGLVKCRQGQRREVVLKAAGGSRVSHHDGTVADLCRHLDLLLHRRPRPSGYLVSHPEHMLTALGRLIYCNLGVPKEISLISRDDESFLQHVLPTVARYSASPSAMARKVSRLVLEMVEGGAIQPRDYRLMPEFTPGESLESWKAVASPTDRDVSR